MHKLTTSFILGYHGCDREIGENILAGNKFEPSQNNYDWLGEGVYFWEANPKRAYQFAEEKLARREIKTPFVVGAVVDLGICLDLQTTAGIDKIQEGFELITTMHRLSETAMPTNSDDLMKRPLDCEVIDWLYRLIEDGILEDPPFDSVRGIFVEGEPAYEGAGIMTKTHTQIAVRNINCIKGVFRVDKEEYDPIF